MNKKKRIEFRLFYCILMFMSIVSSCRHTTQQPSSSPYFEWTDSYGRHVVLDKEPARLVSLSPGITEMLFMLESGNKLVGITDFCQYPPETKNITKVGGIQNFNIEHLLSLNPDVVLIGSIVSKEDVEKIEKIGIPVIAVKEEKEIDGIYNALAILGKIVNKEELARQRIEELKKKMDQVELLVQDLAYYPSVYYVVGFGDAGDYTAPGNSHIHEIIRLAGGKNVGGDLTGWNISREYLFREEPELIFIRREDMKQFENTYPYTRLKAVQQKRLYPIESGWIDIVSPRNILAVELMNERIKEMQP